MLECVNIYTGEVKKRLNSTRIWIPVRKGEHFKEGSSLTVPDQVESLQSIIARCQRDGIPPSMLAKQGYVDQSSEFGPEDEVDSPDFDLADVPSLVASASADLTASSEAVAEPKDNKIDSSSETKSSDDSNLKSE